MLRKILITTVIIVIVLAGLRPCATAENRNAQQMPPANVVVSKVTSGTISPEQEFIGTIYYQEVSDVSAEVSGIVESIKFEEGQPIAKGEALIRLDSNLLEKDLQAKKASYEQTLFDLEKARKDFERTENLFKKRIVAEKQYDDQNLRVKSLEKKTASLKAAFEYLEIEIQKTLIRAPFNGVVIKRHIARGEWLSPGKTVATIARDDTVNIVVEVPEEVTRYLKYGMVTKAMVAGKENTGTIIAVIPKGDIATRTFPVKIRVNNPTSLLEGMEARVRLPVGEEVNALLVPRDAALDTSGSTVVVAVVDSKALLIPVRVVGYHGTKIGIKSQKISKGMKVVVKGNERLGNGQAVRIIKEVE